MRHCLLWPPLDMFTVKLSPSHVRQSMSRLYEEKIEKQWSDIVQTKHVLNRTTFRLHKTKYTMNNTPDEGIKTNCKCRGNCDCYKGAKINPEQFVLNLGMSSIKESMSTNDCYLADDLSYLGYELYKKPQMFLADTISVHTIVITSDGQIPVVKSIPVDSFENSDEIKLSDTNLTTAIEDLNVKWKFPSTIPRPSEVGINGYEDFVSGNNENAQNELYQCILRQLSDDLGIIPEEIGSPKLLAVYYDEEKSNKPELIFVISSQLTSKHIIKMYTKSKKSPSLYSLGFVKTIDMMIPITSKETFPISHFIPSERNTDTDIIADKKCFIKRVELSEIDGLFKNILMFCLSHNVNFNVLIRQ